MATHLDAFLSSPSLTHYIACQRAEELSAALPSGSVDLIVTDPPYFRVKSEAWDRAWSTDAEFLRWLSSLMREWRRVLKPNGSIYVFASPRLGWAVEGVVREQFRVINNIRWVKRGRSGAAEKEALRGYFPDSETIIFAEQRGPAGDEWAETCDRLRGEVFEPLRAYLDGERRRSGLSSAQIQDGMLRRTGARYVFERHAFSRSQWELPTREQYEAARDLFNEEGAAEGRPYLARAYDATEAARDSLQVEYERLRATYEHRRRPFFLTPDRPFTDVWAHPVVQRYAGKHPCEKPISIAADIIRASTRPGGLVADFFAGSGTFLATASALGRRAIGCDLDPRWVEASEDRVRRSLAAGRTAEPRPVARPTRERTLSLFDALSAPTTHNSC